VASNFIKSVAVLVSGTAAAQAISIALLPILTRLYTPDEFGLLAVYTAITSILLTFSCMRLEMALPLQRTSKAATEVLDLCLISVFIIGLFTLVISQMIGVFCSGIYGEFEKYIIYLPLGVFAGGSYIAFQYYALRQQEYSLISKSRFLQAISGGVTQVAGSSFGVSALLMGYVFNLGAGFLYLRKHVLPSLKIAHRRLNLKRIRARLNKNIRYPKYSVLESLANTAGAQIPILIIASSLGVAEAAYIYLSLKIMQAPMALLGSSIAQVYYSHAGVEYAAGRLSAHTKKTLLSSYKVCVGPLIFIVLVSYKLIPYVLGEQWETVSYYVMIITPWVILQLLASPISLVMHVVGRQKTFMKLTLVGFMFRVLVVVIAQLYFTQYIVEFFVLSNVLFYVMCLYVYIIAARLNVKVVVLLLIKFIYYPMAWLIFGVVVVKIIDRIIFYFT
jgi:O-antigen/teichoic acid export membrane protein